CEIRLFTQHEVVSELTEVQEDEMSQILLEDAKKIKSGYKLGDIVEVELNMKEFGRQAARSAKSTFASDLKALERKKSYEYFKAFEDEMISAYVVDISDRFITLDIGQQTTTLLPLNELLPNERFNRGDKINVYVKKVEQTTKDPKVFVSRIEKNLVTRLLENYVPEIKEGIIEIKGIARDPGDRCKIAIYSNDPKVDALGSCVGKGGTRIREVVNALNGEKIDLYKWSEDPEEMIKNSLQPADVSKILNIDVMNKTSLVVVPDEQLSLAIGKSGQNVRLAVQSSGWRIDIKPTSQAYEEGLLEGFLF
ncbi:MAG: transcription termination factor NusA, partial [Anaeroplasmataceae bacterium]